MSEHRQSAPGPASPDQDLGVLLAACCVRVVRTLLATLGPAGYGHLTPTQAITLLFIGRGINTVTQLAERAGLTTQAMSNICTVLQADGLLDRQPHTDAARAWPDLVGAQTLQTVRVALAAYAHSPDPASPSTPAPLRWSCPPRSF